MKAYTRMTVADLPVFVHERAKKDQAALEKALALLGSQLTRFRDLLGPAHAAAFKELSVWIEADVGDGVFHYHNHFTLAPGTSGHQTTWAGHSFAATTGDGRCLSAYTAADVPTIARIAGSGTP
ncbi:MAG: hypothetical protein IT381_09375 [Deltaproteobacteria bacterium]|nr:hypothetical protein [Deltaproteobacteria bacterium]